MNDDGLGDWRIQSVTRLAKDLPAAFLGGPSHKAGAPVYLTTSTRDSKGQSIGFITPSATALALNVAINTSIRAKELYGKLVFVDVLTPDGKGKSVRLSNDGQLFDYFECCMITVTFSFQSLEAFCNYTIADKIKGTYKLQRRKEIETVNVIELERKVSTEEKLATVLPNIIGVKSPKGTKIWQDFVKVKDARDSTIHLKSTDQYPKQASKEDQALDTLFYQFLNNDPQDFPKASISVIKYFVSEKNTPRWLLQPLKFLGKEK